MKFVFLFSVVLLFTGCLTAEQQAAIADKTLSSGIGEELPTPSFACANGTNGTPIISPIDDEYRGLELGVNQIAILSDFRRSYYSGVRSDDPVLAPFYESMDTSESMTGPFSLNTDGTRILDRHGVEIILPNDVGFQNETDLIFRHQAIAAFFAAERLGIRSTDPQYNSIYQILAEERAGVRTYSLTPLGTTGVNSVVRCD